MGNRDAQELEHIIRSRGWKPVGIVTDLETALAKLLIQSGLRSGEANEALENVKQVIRSETSKLPPEEQTFFSNELFEEIFFMYVFSKSQDKVYTTMLRSKKLTFLKLNKTDSEVELLSTIFKVHQHQFDQDIEQSKKTRYDTPDHRFKLALEVFCQLRAALCMPEPPNADHESRLEKAMRNTISHSVFIDGARLSIYDTRESSDGVTHEPSIN